MSQKRKRASSFDTDGNGNIIRVEVASSTAARNTTPKSHRSSPLNCIDRTELCEKQTTMDKDDFIELEDLITKEAASGHGQSQDHKTTDTTAENAILVAHKVHHATVLRNPQEASLPSYASEQIGSLDPKETLSGHGQSQQTEARDTRMAKTSSFDKHHAGIATLISAPQDELQSTTYYRTSYTFKQLEAIAQHRSVYGGILPIMFDKTEQELDASILHAATSNVCPREWFHELFSNQNIVQNVDYGDCPENYQYQIPLEVFMDTYKDFDEGVQPKPFHLTVEAMDELILEAAQNHMSVEAFYILMKEIEPFVSALAMDLRFFKEYIARPKAYMARRQEELLAPPNEATCRVELVFKKARRQEQNKGRPGKRGCATS